MTTNEVMARVLPQFFPEHWLDAPGIVFTEFPSRICIGYVLRNEDGYSYIVDEEFSALGLSVEELHGAALANLSRLPSASVSIGKVPGGPEGWLSATDDNFAAVRILLPEVQREFRHALGETFLFTIPHRDDCFCWSLTQPPERQEKHALQALEDFLHEDYKLTPDILLFQDGTFYLHLKQSAEPSDPPNDGPATSVENSDASGGAVIGDLGRWP
jgi:hypothetical protein